MSKSKKCKDCRWWVPSPGSHADALEISNGDCRTHSPKLIGNDEAVNTVWPWTMGGDFCGDWEEQPDVATN